MLSDLDDLPSVQIGDYTLRFELEDLTPFGREVAANELRETPERKAEAIVELRNLLKGNYVISCCFFITHSMTLLYFVKSL